MHKIIRTVCQGCHPECGVLVHVEDGKVVKIEGDRKHPTTRGCICLKGRVYHELTCHPDRLKYPLKRAGGKAEGKWQRISWEQALTEIAEKVTAIREKYGPSSNSVLHGTGPRPSIPAAQLLANSMGTPNVISPDLHICAMPATVSDTITLGKFLPNGDNTITLEQGPDFLASKCILVWGANPQAAHLPRHLDILEAKRRHAGLIVVDPRFTALASKADIWLQIRPGTDGALALAFLNVIINEDLFDKEFVKTWCYGFDKLVERVQEYSPEKIENITRVPPDKVRAAARLFAANRPASLYQRLGVHQNLGSTQTSRALINLVAITGNIDVAGGNIWQTPLQGSGGGLSAGSSYKTAPEVYEQRLGFKQFPLISGPDAPWPFVHGDLAIEAMLTGKPYPLKGLFCIGCNPVMVMHDTKRIWKALKTLELLVVTDFFMTSTAELADYVLPATTWMEREEVCGWGYNNCFAARQKVMEPRFESRDDFEIVLELVKKLPWANRNVVPWSSVKERNEFMVTGMGVTFAELKERGYILIPPRYKKYAEKGFPTPTGKVELYSTLFEKYGYDPLPHYTEPPEGPLSSPELMQEYPFILITGAKTMEYYHSQGYQVSTLRQHLPYPYLSLHPEAARKANIRDGDWVWLETPKVKGERVRFKVKLTGSLDPGVVSAVHAWWYPEKPAPEHGCFESNINVVLSDGPPREPVCGSVPLRGTVCKIYK